MEKLVICLENKILELESKLEIYPNLDDQFRVEMNEKIGNDIRLELYASEGISSDISYSIKGPKGTLSRKLIGNYNLSGGTEDLKWKNKYRLSIP